MVAHRRAVGGGDWSFDGVHQLWIRDGKNVVALSCDCAVRAHRCLRVDPWCIESYSSRDHVARDYQWHFVWRRLGLVFLFQTKRRGLFSRARGPIMSQLAEPWRQLM